MERESLIAESRVSQASLIRISQNVGSKFAAEQVKVRNRLVRLSPWLSSSLSALGLLAILARPAHAISMAGGAQWGTPGNNGASALLGYTSQETCFLSGITGSLIGNPGIYGEGGFLPASVEVYPYNGRWWIRTRAGVGPGAMAHVTCVNVPYPGASHEFSWSDNLSSGQLPDVPNRQCFLRKVWASAGLDGPTTNIRIRKLNGYWTFHGSYVHNQGGDYGFGGGIALCIDKPITGYWSYQWGAGTNANNNAIATLTLRNYYPYGPGVPITNVGCWLRGIAGRWISGSPNPLGWYNGVYLTRNANVSPYWLMTATNGRTGYSACIR
jgi:hypothetical protein